MRDFLARLTRQALAPPQPAARDHKTGAEVPASEACKGALDGLVKVAFAAGARAERSRIEAIVRMPQAARFPRLAMSVALSGAFGVDQALEAFAAAEIDASATPKPTEPPAMESDGRVLH